MAVVKDHHTSGSRLFPCVFQALHRTHLRVVIVGEHVPKDGLYPLGRELLVLFLFQATIRRAEEVSPFQKIKTFPCRMDIFGGRRVPAILMMHAVSSQEMSLCADSGHQVWVLLHILSNQKKSGLRTELFECIQNE